MNSPSEKPPDPKPRTNRAIELAILRGMTPEERIAQAFKLTERARRLMMQGFRNRFPELSDHELHQLYLKRLARCHNQNW